MKRHAKSMKAKDLLAYGHEVEYYVLKRIRKKFPNALIKKGNHPEYDIFVPETGTKIEIKADLGVHDTGNFVVETEYAGYPSAFSVSTADWWVFFDAERLIWISKPSLKRAIKESGCKVKEFYGGSDRFSKKAYLIPEYFIEENAEMIQSPLTDLPEHLKLKK